MLFAMIISFLKWKFVKKKFLSKTLTVFISIAFVFPDSWIFFPFSQKKFRYWIFFPLIEFFKHKKHDFFHKVIDRYQLSRST